MTQDEIIELARQAGFTAGYGSPALPKHEAFAKLVADVATAKEREACAKVCDDIDAECEGEAVSATWFSKAIRARGETTSRGESK